MSFIDRFLKRKNTDKKLSTTPTVADNKVQHEPLRYAMVDTEVGLRDKKIHDIGSVRYDGAVFHAADKAAFLAFVSDVDYICGHNIIQHDAHYLFNEDNRDYKLVDTLYLSALLFPERPYHKLVKDDKLLTEEVNNPVNDCQKAQDLLMDEVAQWQRMSHDKQLIFATLLRHQEAFSGFLQFVNAAYTDQDLTHLIAETYKGKLCAHTDLLPLIQNEPCELAYALSLIDTSDHRSITPGWILHSFPTVEAVIHRLRHQPCIEGCAYCNTRLDVFQNLKHFFGYDKFRTYEGDPLQEKAVKAAVEGQSLLAIFPTGGGKSLTFQLPALMSGHTVHGLTVVISPLQSLMKDQVDNLNDRGITDAVTINGMLDPISRSLAIERVMNGDASLLYIAPEMLRSKTIEKILLARHVVRFVIDEAHCFSSWGQDFRVDYLYIGKFIRRYQEKKGTQPIPISCFTATAKQKVIQDICDYFKQQLSTNLQLFASTAARTNLRYAVIHADTDEDKYVKLRGLMSENSCPAIVYVSRTMRTDQLAKKLQRDGFEALPYHGRMEPEEKIANQEAFMQDRVRIIVATSAFGMGVDKKDVGIVVHYDISDSLENYVQEAGRAGRDPELNARCFVLYSDNDLDKHFILLNQTKLSISEIQQVWKAVKNMTRERLRINCSALEIARTAGWDDSVSDIETRVRTALAALEQSGYLIRGNNVPHVYATGITVKNVEEARQRIGSSILFDNEETEKAVRIIKSLISQKNTAKGRDAEAESRVDYLADILGLNKQEVVSVVERMRQEGILADSKDISAYLIESANPEKKTYNLLENFIKLERHLLNRLQAADLQTSCKQLNDHAVNEGIDTAKEKDIRTLLYFLTVKGYMRKKEDAAHNLILHRQTELKDIFQRFEKRIEICKFAVNWLYRLMEKSDTESIRTNGVRFSVIELLNDFKAQHDNLFYQNKELNLEEVEEALLYLSKIGALKLEGGFMILYNAMEIQRVKDNKVRYKIEDYKMLNEFYKQKIQQVHIVGEYANLMVKDYGTALQYVQDYFQMDYKKFITKYFKEERIEEIERNLTPAKYNQLFGQLSTRQMNIITDKESRCIVVAAGPGSGKTRVLVHKLASLLLLEDVKHEQLLMLTFSRAAATEFKQRLMTLIGNAAHFVEIKTFHAYCFDLLGRVGSIEESKDVVAKAAEMIEQGEVEPNRIGKTVLVIDEAQDMSRSEYMLVRALMKQNEEMRLIAVGDDDQNIYEFRGSESKYMFKLLQDGNGKVVEMTENYRSCQHPVMFANAFTAQMANRMKNKAIVSMRSENGWVKVSKHVHEMMYQPLVEELVANRCKGSCCVITQTNESAVIVMGLLRKQGVNCKLIQSMDGFHFSNLAEVRYFLKYINKHLYGTLIDDSLWQNAKEATYQHYAGSESLAYLQRCIALFESTNRMKYATDFREFLYESSIEDFCDTAGAEVIISTIHKAKGREFDDVYMLINDKRMCSEEVLRCYYVGMTRAKNRLFIHTNSDRFKLPSVDEYVTDDRHYTMPTEIMLQLSHKDVYLHAFKEHKARILALRGGDKLGYRNAELLASADGKPIGKLSARMLKTLEEWQVKGYKVKEVSVRFIVAWKPKDSDKQEKEWAVVLADMVLTQARDEAEA